MGWNVSVWYCCTAHYVIVDQRNRSLLNLLKIPPERKSSARCLVRWTILLSRTLDDIVVPHVGRYCCPARWTILLSRTWDGDNFLGPCMYFIFPFHIVTSYTLIYTHAQLTDCEASRKAYGLSSFARYDTDSNSYYTSHTLLLCKWALICTPLIPRSSTWLRRACALLNLSPLPV